MSLGSEPIRSYRRIFRPERRIYQIEGHVLPVPGGVPLRWLAYTAAALAAVIALGSGSTAVATIVGLGAASVGGLLGGRVTAAAAGACALAGTWVLGLALGLVDWPLRLLVLPAAVGTLATQATPDGRRADRFAASWLALRLAPRRRSLGRATPPAGARQSCEAGLWVSPDEHTPALRRARLRGPAELAFGVPVALRRAGPFRRRLVARPPRTPWRGGGRRYAARARRRRALGGATLIRFPLRYARRNVLIGPGGEAAGLYRAETVSYPFRPVAEKWELLRRLERFAHLVGADFSIWRVQRAYPAERYARELEGAADVDHADPEVWRAYLRGHEARLAELAPSVPEVYVAVSLGERPKGHLRSLDRARRRVEEVAGVGGPQPIGGAELQELAAAEQRCFERLSALIGLRRATTRELQWLLCRAACRGVAEPELEAAWEPDALRVESEGEASYEPLEYDLWRCANAPMTEAPAEPPSLEVEAEDDRSYQAFLCAGSLAEEAEFPGDAELLFAPIEDAGFPVDAVLHARWIGNREALGQVRKRILDVEHAYREQAEGAQAGPGWQAEEDRELAREYEAVLQSSAHPPMLRAYLGIAVGAAERTELERRVEALRERFGEVRLHRPRGLQHRLFFDHLPRTDGGSVPDYRQQMTVEQLGAMVPTATAEVGSPQGTYIGYMPAAASRPVRYDPTEAPRTARPSAVLLAGTLGSGKTLAAQAIAYAALCRGSLVVDFDPKPDHNLEGIPGLEEKVEVIELSGDPRHRGKLDPLRVGLPELREELASSYLLELLRDPPPSWENAIDRAVRDAVRAGERSLLGVVARLRASESGPAREAGEALEVISDFGLARLGFAAQEAA